MKGFTDKALILLSTWDDFSQSSSMYKYDYKRAVDNLILYLDSVNVKRACLITDQMAARINMHNPLWLATGAPEDMFFMQNFCSVPKYETQALPEALQEKLRSKFPLTRGMEPKERFSVVSKRVKYAEKELISSYDFVVVFGKQFNVKTHPGDGRAVMHVSDRGFIATLELSGEFVPINSFLQLGYANQSLSEWGKYSGNESILDA